MEKELFSNKIGHIKYQTKDIITFPNGLFGFESYKQFLLVKNNGNDIFFYLQSVDDFLLTFILANPRLFLKDYVLDVDEVFVKDMEIKKIIDFGIVTVAEKTASLSINLLGPILIDLKNQIGTQAISLKKNYSTKQEIKNLKIKNALSSKKVS